MGVRSDAPVAASQSRAVWSYDPDTTDLPSGEKATEVTKRKALKRLQ